MPPTRPRRLAVRSALAALAAVACSLAATSPASAAAARPCSSVAHERCGTLSVPLDHGGATPGRQTVGYALLPATGRRVGAMAILVGGPGQGATDLARKIAGVFAPLHRVYDLLLVDQRGIGRSGAVSCPGLDPLSIRSMAACGRRIGARRAFLTTREDAADLDDVRAALHLDRLTLVGISYGAGIAADYARLYPQHVTRVVLDSPVQTGGLDILGLMRDAALPRVLRGICLGGACASFLPRQPVDAVAKLAARLQRRSLPGTVVLPNGRVRRTRLTWSLLYQAIAASDLDPSLRSALPAGIASALAGDANPLLRATGGGTAPTEEVGGLSLARFAATSCIEAAIPWDTQASTSTRARQLVAYLDGLPAAAFAPFGRAAVFALSIARGCVGWPPTPRPAAVPARGPNVPVLVLSGRDDLRTPTEGARLVAAAYPQAHFVGIVHSGHSVLSSDASGCALLVTAEFLAGRPIAFCRIGPRVPDVAPFVPASLARIRPVPGLHGAIGRTAMALFATIVDANRTATQAALAGARRAGGLRGGTLAIGPRGVLVLRRYSLVRGVTITAVIRPRARRFGVIVGGRAALHGSIVFGPRRADGHLGRALVTLRYEPSELRG